MIKRARLIYNPTSGREEMRRRLPDVLNRLEGYGYETSTHATMGAGDATRAAAEAARRGFDIVIAAGGDGTINEVVAGLAEAENRPPLGILPVGTTNDLARALGIPRSWDGAIDVIAEGHMRQVDIGRLNDRYFINIAGGGSLTELTYEVPSKMKTVLGQLAYYMKGLEKLPRFRPIELTIRSAEMMLHEDFMLFLIANTSSVGGIEHLAPDARIDDGLMDVFLLRRCTLADFIRIVSHILRGERVNDPLVVHFQTKYLTIESKDYVQLNVDGEFGGTLPCEIEVLPKHLDLYFPTGGQGYYARQGQPGTSSVGFHPGGGFMMSGVWTQIEET